ncbi:MAG: tetratricopeptide repeat protein [Candidatus Gastranaerophilales bacterium]|nr:tetratricopeptide repeat protein [Candidatus Gastranaerophilales bacterium]
MNLIIKLLKLRITKVFLSILMIAFIASLYFCRNWYYIQYHKCIGFYYVHKGDKAYKKAQYQKAINYYKKALQNYPGHSRASCNLGNIYVSFENYYEAVNAYENALKYSPNFMVCRMDLGIILSEKLANYDKAIQEYGRVVNSKPFTIKIPFVFDNKEAARKNKGLAYYNMGLAYRGKAVYMGDRTSTSVKYLKKAKEAYLKAGEYLKNDFDNTYNLALTNHLLGDYNSAGSEYCKAINIKPDSFEAHYNFALLLRSMNKNLEALNEFEKTTMLLDYYGDDNNNKNKYIFGIINEIKRRILNEGNYDYLKERDDLTSLKKEDITYYHGKVLVSKQKSFKMNNLLKCTYENQFEEMD